MSGSQAVYEAVGNRKVARAGRSCLKIIEANVLLPTPPIAQTLLQDEIHCARWSIIRPGFKGQPSTPVHDQQKSSGHST